jgi:prepilin-type N-terminal cleavage/methylation domain-containing protein
MVKQAVSNAKAGFTLLELILVVSIIAILATIAIPNFVGGQDKAYEDAMIADLRNLITAQQLYRAQDGSVSYVGGTIMLAADGTVDASLFDIDGTETTPNVDPEDFPYSTSNNVGVNIDLLTQSEFQAVARHQQIRSRQCALQVRRNQGSQIECYDLAADWDNGLTGGSWDDKP